MTKFTDLGLVKPLLQALAQQGYETPTPIQAQAIPSVLAGRDLLGIAQTGTGKTAAFALPILQRLANDRRPAPRGGCRALVLSPTRELATQIAESFRTYGAHLGMTVAVIFGGAKYGPQERALNGGIDILVATPGRLMDHMAQRTARLGETEIFVLDEADQMLDLGFLVPIRKIVGHLKKERQNLFFSATMPTEIGRLAGELLKDPVRVEVTPQATTVEKVDQRMIFVEAARKRELLAELFADPKFTRTIVFTRTKRGADKVTKYLDACGVTAAAIHGDKSQSQRERALASFKAGKVRALVATDIAARGIDIDDVSHVVNFELPFVPEAYVHRIGRTARAGATGSAVSFCADDERQQLRDIQRLTRQTIPAFDRRRDKALGAAAAAMAAAMPDERREPRRPEPGEKLPPRLRAQHQQRAPQGGAPRGDRADVVAADMARNNPKRRRRPNGGGFKGGPGGGGQGRPAQNTQPRDKAPRGQTSGWSPI